MDKHHPNIRRSKKDPREYQELFAFPRQQGIFDLRPYDLGIETQGDIGSCVGNAIASGYEIMLNQQYPGSSLNLSRLFLYFNARVIEDDVEADVGASIRSALRAGEYFGLCSEAIWPYDESKFDDKPTAESYCDAAYRKIKSFKRLWDPRDVISSIENNRPVVVGIDLYENFNRITKENPFLNLPLYSDQYIGAHAMLIVGYDNTAGTAGDFILKNSYGPAWGDNGYCYMNQRTFLYNQIFDLYSFEIDVPSGFGTTSTTSTSVLSSSVR